MNDLLNVRNLAVEFHVHEGAIRAVNGVSFRVPQAGVVALVGESGSGKSVVSQSIMGILPQAARITGGEILFRDPAIGRGHRHRRARPRQQAHARDPRRPHLDHLPGADDLAVAAAHGRRPGRREALRLHRDVPRRKDALALTAEMLRLVGFPDPEQALADLSVRAVGRPAPARDDRHGAGVPPGAADRRRADHRARRHHPGADPEAAEGSAGRARHGGAADHPRSRRRRQHGRRGRGHVSRPGDGERHRRRHLRAIRATPISRRCCARCRASTWSRASGCSRCARSSTTTGHLLARREEPGRRPTATTRRCSRSRG